MIIRELFQQLESATNPIAKLMRKGENFKVVAIGFKKGMILKEHTTKLPAKLTVLSGSIIYKETSIEKQLQQYEETEIPPNLLHSVECLEDSLCILIQG